MPTLFPRHVSDCIIYSWNGPLTTNTGADILTAAGNAPGVEAFKYIVPAEPFSKGCVIRAIKFSVFGEFGTWDGTFDVQVGTTSLLDGGSFALTAAGTSVRTLTPDDPILEPGDVLTIDCTETSAGDWDGIANGIDALTVQIDIDSLGHEAAAQIGGGS